MEALDAGHLLTCVQNARSLAGELDRDLAEVLVHHRDRASDLGLDHARFLARDLMATLELSLDRGVDRAREVVRELLLGLDRACVQARGLYVDRAIESKLVDYTRMVREISDQLEYAGLPAHEALARGSEQGAEGLREPWSVATRVTGWLVRVLPAAYQPLYREVYQSELFDLAQTERPRRAQLAYTVRTLMSVVSLRRALRAPAPQPRRQSW